MESGCKPSEQARIYRKIQGSSLVQKSGHGMTVRSDGSHVMSSHNEQGEFMSTGSLNVNETKRVLSALINVLQDSQKGFADIGEHLKDETLKRYFLAESLKRANFRAELENELHRHGVKDIHEEGTTAGALHRAWGDLKAKVMNVSDHELLATAEQGEDQAKKVYKDALEQDLPLPVRQLLTEQNTHIVASHDYVRDHRDATASK